MRASRARIARGAAHRESAGRISARGAGGEFKFRRGVRAALTGLGWKCDFKRRVKIDALTTVAFAVCGFSICWILLFYYGYAHAHQHLPSMRLFYALCPDSIISVGLDDASLAVGLLGWVLIGLMNAVRYAIAGVLIGILVAVIDSKFSRRSPEIESRKQGLTLGE